MLERLEMVTLEERFSKVEGRVHEQSQGLAALRDDIAHLDGRLSENITRLDVRMSENIARLDGRMSENIARLDSRLSDNIARLDDRLSDRIDRLDDKMSRQFAWLVGLLVTGVVAGIGGVLSR